MFAVYYSSPLTFSPQGDYGRNTVYGYYSQTHIPMWLNTVQGSGGRCGVSTLDTQSEGCKVCAPARLPDCSEGPADPGPGCLSLGRAAPGRPRPAAGGGSPPCPGADPCSAGRILHRTCRVQLLRGAADTNARGSFCETDSITVISYRQTSIRSTGIEMNRLRLFQPTTAPELLNF